MSCSSFHKISFCHIFEVSGRLLLIFLLFHFHKPRANIFSHNFDGLLRTRNFKFNFPFIIFSLAFYYGSSSCSAVHWTCYFYTFDFETEVNEQVRIVYCALFRNFFFIIVIINKSVRRTDKPTDGTRLGKSLCVFFFSFRNLCLAFHFRCLLFVMKPTTA